MKGTKWKMWKPRGKGQLLFLASLIVLCVVVLYYANKSVSITGDFSGESRESDRFRTEVLSAWWNTYETMNDPKNEDKERVLKKFNGEKIVHLDLKGAPPKVDYLLRFFPLLKTMGATGVLIEYEDMFPYSKEEIPALNKYSRGQIAQIIESAYKNNLSVIPLVQVFGHLEFVLKTQAFMGYREDQGNPQAICPSLNESRTLLTSMIDDIVAAHPHSKQIHIGCDEVFTLGTCPRCKKRLQNKMWTKNQLFLDHVSSIASYIKRKYPHLTVLTWDDEFRRLTEEEMKAFNMGQLIEPVVWNYQEHVGLPWELWKKYSTVFPKIWIASAYKGANQPNSVGVNTSIYLANHLSWMDIVATYSKFVEFTGIIMTGWQRYDHFSVLCELLPVAIPTLALNLLIINGDRNQHFMSDKVKLSLRCNRSPVMVDRISTSIACTFPGAGIFETVSRQVYVVEGIKELKSDSHFTGWMSPYNLENNFSSPEPISFVLKKLQTLLYDLTELEILISSSMDEAYDNYTISEWIATHITPYKNDLLALDAWSRKLLEREVWPRRPLPLTKDL